MLDVAETAEPPIIVVDLSEIEYFSNAFNRVLIDVWNKLRERNGQLALCGLQPTCHEVIKVTRLDQLWKVYRSGDDAVADLGANGES